MILPAVPGPDDFKIKICEGWSAHTPRSWRRFCSPSLLSCSSYSCPRRIRGCNTWWPEHWQPRERCYPSFCGWLWGLTGAISRPKADRAHRSTTNPLLAADGRRYDVTALIEFLDTREQFASIRYWVSGSSPGGKWFGPRLASAQTSGAEGVGDFKHGAEHALGPSDKIPTDVSCSYLRSSAFICGQFLFPAPATCAHTLRDPKAPSTRRRSNP